MHELLEGIEALRAIPGMLKREIARTAVAVGIDAYPEIHALVKKHDGKWELVAVSLDPALLPAPEDGAIRCIARLDLAKDPEKT